MYSPCIKISHISASGLEVSNSKAILLNKRQRLPVILKSTEELNTFANL